MTISIRLQQDDIYRNDDLIALGVTAQQVRERVETWERFCNENGRFLQEMWDDLTMPDGTVHDSHVYVEGDDEDDPTPPTLPAQVRVDLYRTYTDPDGCLNTDGAYPIGGAVCYVLPGEGIPPLRTESPWGKNRPTEPGETSPSVPGPPTTGAAGR